MQENLWSWPPFGGSTIQPRRAARLPIWGSAACHALPVLTTLVLVLAGITAWCVASLALALIVGPMVRRAAGAERGLVADRRPMTGAIPLPVVH
ncbi:hypothetical protein GCM10025783_10190 [Amnibacterium soli]|uniref:Uncharacterized protein n=1 Tax=Amnibacterium soli TaxID=1282736 RepID=A0ABP8YVV4_9MICO